jgi:hypothetical protein
MKTKLNYKIAALFMAVGLLTIPAVTLAQDSTCSGSQDSCTQLQDVNDDNSGTKANDSTELKARREARLDQAKEQAQEHIAELKAQAKEHSAEQRKKNCRAAEHGLTKKLSMLQKNSAKFKSQIDSTLQRAIQFKQDNNITTVDYEANLAAAQSAQGQAQSSVAALSSLSINLDCSSGSVAQNVATFRAAASQTRSDLKTYRQAVKALIKDLRKANDEKSQ